MARAWPGGKRKHRRMVIGLSMSSLMNRLLANGLPALDLEINFTDARMNDKTLTISELVDHYRAS